MQSETNDKFTAYKDAVNQVNGLAESRFDEYYTVIENMLQLDKGRVEFVKTLIEKYLSFTEYMAKVYTGKALSIREIAERINGEADLNAFVRETRKKVLPPSKGDQEKVIDLDKDISEGEKVNALFVPLECSTYKST